MTKENITSTQSAESLQNADIESEQISSTPKSKKRITKSKKTLSQNPANDSSKDNKNVKSDINATKKQEPKKLTTKEVAKARKIIKKQSKLDEQQPQHNIKHLLDDDEKVILTRTPHRKSYLGAAIASVVCGILSLAAINAIVLFFMLNDGVSQLDVAFLILISIIDLVAIFLCFKYSVFALLGVDNIEYVFTNKKIIISRGISTIHFDFLSYKDIESTRLKIGPIDKIFAVGDIYIHTKRRLVIIFDIHDSKHIMDKLNKLIVKSK